MKKVEYKVTGLSCISCATSVERILRRNKGVSEVKVEGFENRVTVDYDEALVNDDTLLNQINRLGFKAVLKHETN